MRLLYFEIRKNFLRKFLISTIICFILLNIVVIYKNYKVGEGPFSEEMNPNTTSQEEWNFYESLHKQFDGTMTNENVQYIIDENTRLGNAIENQSFSKNYDESTYTGYINGDYVTINKYFYLPMEYRAMYASNMEKLVSKAKENVEFYQQFGNLYEINKNTYIMNQYKDRKITDFYETLNWKNLFDYKFSDLMICILMLLGLISIFHNEKDTGMFDLINSSKEGKKNMEVSKYIAAFVYITFLVISFSLVNIIAYRLLFGLSGWSQPLYAIKAYEYTPLNCSVLGFYVLSSAIKLVGFLIVGFFFCIISKISVNIVWSYIVSVLFMVAGIFVSGYVNGIKTVHIYLAIVSPFTLLKGSELFQNLLGVDIGGQFVTRGFASLIFQGSLLVLFFIKKFQRR